MTFYLRIFTISMCLSSIGCTNSNDKRIEKNEISNAPSQSSQTLSQDGDPTFINTKDTTSTIGPTSITRGVLKDRIGNIWLATWQGIIKYDGKVFTNYTIKENLRRYHSFSILEDRRGNLWFGMIGGGLYKFDGTNFTNFTTSDQIGGNTIMSMVEDNSGNIWFGTNNGLTVYNGISFITYSKQQGLNSNTISNLEKDQSGNIWVSTPEGVNLYNGNTFLNFKNAEGHSFNNVIYIKEDKNKTLWISCQDGLIKYDGKKFTSLFQNFSGNIYEDKKGNMWLTSSDGKEMSLVKYDGNSFLKIKSSTQVFGIDEDLAGNIWFGTANGVLKYDGKSFNDFH